MPRKATRGKNFVPPQAFVPLRVFVFAHLERRNDFEFEFDFDLDFELVGLT